LIDGEYQHLGEDDGAADIVAERILVGVLEEYAHGLTYQRQRGMEFEHNVHDWMGGYPYESISAAEVEALMQPLGFTRIWSMATPLTIGFFGSGCDEYLYRRKG